MSGKKILFILQLPPPVHGVSTMNEIILDHLQNQGIYDLKVIPLKFAKTFNELRKISFLKLFRFVKIYFQIIHVLNFFKPELVYFSFMPVGLGFIRDYFYLKIIKRYSIKIVLHLHNRGISKNSKNLVYKNLYQSAFQNITLVHVSDTLIDDELKNLKLKNCKRIVIPNTCRLFSERVRNSNKKTTTDVLYCSNIFPEKGYRIALEAMKILSSEQRSIRLMLCGQPFRKRYEKEINRFIRKNDLMGTVIYKGPVFGEEKERIFNESDIFIFPSYFNEECFPLVILEAMSAGIPIIATRIGGIPEIIEDRISGLLINSNNVDQLAEKIKFLAMNKRISAELAKNVKNRYQVKYNRDKFEERLDKLISELFFEKE